MSDDLKLKIAVLEERIESKFNQADSKAEKAHVRIDTEVGRLVVLIHEFRDWMNQTKGRDKVLLFGATFAGTIIGGIIVGVVTYAIKKS